MHPIRPTPPDAPAAARRIARAVAATCALLGVCCLLGAFALHEQAAAAPANAAPGEEASTPPPPAPAEAPAPPDPDAPPRDPAVTSRTLPSGVTAIIREHAPAPDTAPVAGLRLVVHAGSLLDAQGASGLSHTLMHAAFGDTAAMSQADRDAYFARIGQTHGPHRSAFIGGDRTIFQIDLPGDDEAQLREGLRVLASLAATPGLSDDDLASARRAVLSELRSWSSTAMRMNTQALEILLEGSGVSGFSILGNEEGVAALTRDLLLDAHAALYAPVRLTVIVASSQPSDRVAAMVDEAFSQLAPPADRADAYTPPSFKPDDLPARFAALHGEGAAQSHIEIVRLQTTTPDAHESLKNTVLRRLAYRLVGARLERQITDTAVSFREAMPFDSRLSDGVRFRGVHVVTRAEQWERALADLAAELHRLTTHGPTRGEIFAQANALFQEIEADAETARTESGHAAAERIAKSLLTGDAPLTAPGAADAARTALATAQASDLLAHLSAYAPQGASAMAVLPHEPPKDADLEDIVRDATEFVLGQIDDAPPFAPLTLPELAKGGPSADSLHADRASGVVSAHFENGAIVRRREMPADGGRAIFRVTLSGGELEETAENRGVTDAAISAWRTPATHTLSAAQMRAWTTARGIEIKPRLDRGGASLEVRFPVSQIEPALATAHALLREPRIEPAALERWRVEALTEIASREVVPNARLRQTLARAVYADDEPRGPLPTAQQIEAVTLDQAQAWLDRLVAHAPIEAAIVGPIPRHEALTLAARAVASLPARSMPGDPSIDELRNARRRDLPTEIRERLSGSGANSGVALAGFFGADSSAIEHTAHLTLAARLVTDALDGRLRVERGLTPSVHAAHAPAESHRGTGLFYIASFATDETADAILDAAATEFTRLASEGPSAEQMERARTEALRLMDEKRAGASAWAEALSTAQSRERPVDALLRERDAVRSATAEQVRETFAKYLGDGSLLRIVILPED